MKKKLLIVFVFFLCYASTVIGQSEIGEQEDFEDDTVGQQPSQEWYSYTLSNPPTGCCSFWAVESGGADGTSKNMRFNAETNEEPFAHPQSTFTFAPEQYNTTSFYLNSNNGFQQDVIRMLIETGSNELIQEIRIGEIGGDGVWLQGTGGTCDSGGDCLWTDTNWHRVDMQFDWGAQRIDYFVDGSLVHDNQPFISTVSDTTLGRFRFRTLNNDQGDAQFDQWQLDGGPLAPGPSNLEKSDFANGLITTINELGFVSFSSLMMFGLILVGATAVTLSAFTKLFSNGAIRNWVIHGSSALVGSFLVLVGMLQLWQFTVAIVITTALNVGIPTVISTLRQAPGVERDNEPIEGRVTDLGDQSSIALSLGDEQSEGDDED